MARVHARDGRLPRGPSRASLASAGRGAAPEGVRRVGTVRRDDEPEYPWGDGATYGWKEWYSAHRDARAEMLCTARENFTQLVEISGEREAWIPALRELTRLDLIEFFELDQWPLVTENLRSLSVSDALIALEDPSRWDPDDGKPRVVFATTEKGDRAARAEAFHFNNGRFVEWSE